jgi:hypothetical protein
LYLQDGRGIFINPQTQKTMRSDVPDTSLWDGTHRLDDGSVIIIREGVVINDGSQSSAAPTPLEATDASELFTNSVESLPNHTHNTTMSINNVLLL